MMETKTYTQYPWRSVALYNGTTLAHFLIGGAGIWLGLGAVAGFIYLLFAFGQMYWIMPRRVCPNCPYYRLEGGRCVSALNLLARRIAAPGKPQRFKLRAQGVLCHNNLYLAALIAPVPLILLGLVANYSIALLPLVAGVVALLLFRFLILFKRVACVHCIAKQRCPNAKQMGLA